MPSRLTPILAPRSVALVGAGERPTSSGGATMQLLQQSGYKGEIYPVNTRGGTIFGRPAYTSISHLPAPAELVVIVIRPDLIIPAVAEAAAAGHRNFLILPGGFAEAGSAGEARNRALQDLITQYDLTVTGPNCAGIISLAGDWPFAPTFLRCLPPGPGPRGGIAFISQSGAIAEELVNKANADNLPLSTVVTVGNSLQLGIEDFLAELGGHDEISTILLYIESVADPAKFHTVASRLAAHKPIVALFGGRTAPGARAASLHTGAVINSDGAIEEFCRDAGMIRVRSLHQLGLAAKGFGFYPTGIGSRVAILSNAGGPGVLTADMAASSGLQIPPLPNAVGHILGPALPGEAAIANPMDILADARGERFAAAMAALLAHGPGQFDAILGIHVTPFMVDTGEVVEALAQQAATARQANIPFFHAMMGSLPQKQAWFATMEKAGVPAFDDAEAMAICAALLAQYPQARARANSAHQGPIAPRARR